jgi:hypothetical protein
MPLTKEQQKIRFHKEAGAQGAGSSFLLIFGGAALTALAGFGIGLFVLGVCFLIASVREGHQARMEDASIKGRLAGGQAPYPWQGATPSQDEYDEFREESSLIKFGFWFCIVWSILWIPAVVLLSAGIIYI